MKRQKESARKRKQLDKSQRRAERAAERKDREPVADGEDPDIAGIVPGPQPLPVEYGIVDDFRASPAADDDEDTGGGDVGQGGSKG